LGKALHAPSLAYFSNHRGERHKTWALRREIRDTRERIICFGIYLERFNLSKTCCFPHDAKCLDKARRLFYVAIGLLNGAILSLSRWSKFQYELECFGSKVLRLCGFNPVRDAGKRPAFWAITPGEVALAQRLLKRAKKFLRLARAFAEYLPGPALSAASNPGSVVLAEESCWTGSVIAGGAYPWLPMTSRGPGYEQPSPTPRRHYKVRSQRLNDEDGVKSDLVECN
jgi:hypothetical protein